MKGPLPENILRCITPEDRKPMGKAGRTIPEISAANAERLERDIHKKIQSDLLRRGIVYFHSRTDRRTTTAVGLPDFAFVANGTPIAMEVKLPGNVLDDDQLEKRRWMIDNGWKYSVVYSFQEYCELVKKHLNSAY